MAETKYNVGDIVGVAVRVEEIRITKAGKKYTCRPYNGYDEYFDCYEKDIFTILRESEESNP